MDNLALHGHIWTSLQLDHMHPLRRTVDHRGQPYGPDALRLPCAFGAVLFSLAGEYRGLAPLLPDGGGLELWGKLRPTWQAYQVGAFPWIVPDGAGAIASGAVRRQERTAAGFMGLAHPSPVPACLPLGGALEGIRSSALTLCSPSREPVAG